MKFLFSTVLGYVLMTMVSGFCQDFLTPEEVNRRQQKIYHVGCFQDGVPRALTYSDSLRENHVEQCFKICSKHENNCGECTIFRFYSFRFLAYLHTTTSTL